MSETSNPKHGEARSNDARAEGSKPVARKDVTPQGFLSKVERAKQLSGNLRGGIRATLEDADATHFAEDDLVSMKFHGIYQQDDRDARAARRKEGLEKDYSFMIRICVPGGACSAEQYLDIDGLGQRYGDGGLRLTTRQAFQLHGVIKGELGATMREINATLLTSLAACGDVPRNVMASPAPYATEAHREARALAETLSIELAPATGAYHEIWIDGEKAEDANDPERAKAEEPFYGTAYLPRKFKLGVGLDHDNSIDAYAYDAALIGVVEDGRIVGYNLTAGGGFGMTHNKPDTIARVASVIGFVEPRHAVEAMRAVVSVYRDHGNRESRRHARLKYLLEDWGVEKFRSAVSERLDAPLGPARETGAPRQLDHLGRHDQGDGRVFVGVWVPNGRIKDTDEARYASALRQIAAGLAPRFILTPMQSVILADLTPEQADEAERILTKHGVVLASSLSQVRRYSMACPALPTCGLALAESERIQPALIDELEQTFEDLEIDDVPITVRMTGCPNGCARPYNADIGLVGRRPGVYHVFVGGGLSGDRLADLFEADVAIGDLIPTLRPLLERYRSERDAGEPLGDFYRRVIAVDRPTRTLITGKEEPTAERYGLRVLS